MALLIVGGPVLPAHFAAQIRHYALPAAVVTFIFALLAHRMRAVNLSGAIAGAVVSFLLYATSGPGAFVTLAVVFCITAASTRLGHIRKRKLGLAESRRGRNGWQVLANLAVAAVLSVVALYLGRGLLLTCIAALAEAAADTASSEVGKALSTRVYLITTFQRVDVGTDGGISVIGTGSGIAAAIVVALVAMWWRLIPTHWMAAVVGAAILGTIVDSLAGATVQRYGWLNNSAVNLVSTVAAATIALAFLVQ